MELHYLGACEGNHERVSTAEGQALHKAAKDIRKSQKQKLYKHAKSIQVGTGNPELRNRKILSFLAQVLASCLTAGCSK
jgi:hypothetical protein